MGLPAEITTDKIRAVSDMCDSETIQNAIDEAMEMHIGQIIETLTEVYDLSNEQRDELEDRIFWRLELAPVPVDPDAPHWSVNDTHHH